MNNQDEQEPQIDSEWFEERAAIREFDGGMTRQMAEWWAERDLSARNYFASKETLWRVMCR